ncbi:hypothetical protein FOZ60_009416 [Perkinsus olseni]|uniref:Uncharacterized protein n=1 Tax=Perkinsus olseni TaxID=32597 RepID=A0A7J6PDX8_PEROL|nr:hypothetical protein FOZ60_009416 [Perkinsus olseni]
MLITSPLATRIPQGKFTNLRCVELVNIPEVVHRPFSGDWMLLLADEKEGFAVVQPDGDETMLVEVPSVTVGRKITAMAVTSSCSMLAALVAAEDARLELRIWKDIAEMLFTPTGCTTNFAGLLD